MFVIGSLPKTMHALATIGMYEASIILLGLAAVLVGGLLTGRIVVGGLLQADREDGSAHTSSGRAQLLISTIALAIVYLTQQLKDPSRFPTVPLSVVGLMGASHAAYLVSKVANLMNLVDSNRTARREP